VKRLAPALGLAYPLLAHGAVQAHSTALTVASLGVLLLPPLLPGLLGRRAWAWVALATSIGLGYLLWRHADLGALLYLPPVAINLFLAWLFGSSMATGRTPLIGHMVLLMHPVGEPLDPRVAPYTRHLTALWTALFVLLALASALLALLVSPGGVLELCGLASPLPVARSLWSWFANVFNYLIVGALFVVEYAWRRHVFPQQPYRHFGDFILRLFAAAPRLWHDLRTGATTP
jgi:uncharacterized membrane protein